MIFRLFIFVSSLLLSMSQLSCQNWQPISTVGQTNYRVSPPPTINKHPNVDFSLAPDASHPISGGIGLTPFLTLKVDTFSVIGATDTLFYFNLWTYSKNDTIYKNRAPFLEKEMFKTVNGIYYFYNPDTFCIKTQAILNESWEFRAGTHDSARVISVMRDTILGELDSIKIIHLTTGDSIILSQRFGIVHFSDTANVLYDLVGIETSLSNYLGQRMPNTYDVFNYNIGDEFVIEDKWGSNSTFGIHHHEIKKYTVISKQQTSIGYIYNVNYDLWERLNFGNPTISVGYSDTWTYEINNGVNIYIDSCVGGVDVFYSKWTIVYEDNFGRLYKRMIGYSLGTHLGDGVYLYNIHNPDEDVMIYSPNLGRIHWREFPDNSPYIYGNHNLIGYMKNGQAYGDTTLLSRPGSFIPISIIADNKLSDMTIYPQPAKDFLIIEFENIQDREINIELISLQGLIIKNWTFTPTLTCGLKVDNIPQGIYGLRVKSGFNQTIRKVFILGD